MMASISQPSPNPWLAGGQAAVPTALLFYVIVLPLYYLLHFSFWLRRPLTEGEFDLFGNIHIGLKAIALLSMFVAAGPLAARFGANRHLTLFVAMFFVFLSYPYVGNYVIHTTVDSLQPR